MPRAGPRAKLTGMEPTEVTSGDTIRLVLPAEPGYGRIARIAASSLALRLGLSFAAIEDLRLAIDEAVILLLRPGTAGEITIEFGVARDRLTIDADTSSEGPATFEPEAQARFEEIVGDTVDVVTIDGTHVHLVKTF